MKHFQMHISKYDHWTNLMPLPMYFCTVWQYKPYTSDSILIFNNYLCFVMPLP